MVEAAGKIKAADSQGGRKKEAGGAGGKNGKGDRPSFFGSRKRSRIRSAGAKNPVNHDQKASQMQYGSQEG